MGIRTRTALLGSLALSSLVGVQALPAQERAEVVPGAFVRIDSPEYRGEAIVWRVDESALDLGVSGFMQPVVVPISTLRSLEVRARRTGWEGARRGALWGAVIGAALGGFGDSEEEEGDSLAERVVAVTVVGALVGGAVGAIRPGTRWIRVRLSPAP